MTPRHFAWQAWHNLTSTFVLRGRRGTNSHPPSFRVAAVALMALSGALGRGLFARDARDAAALSVAPCVAGVAQSHIHLLFAWQAWRKLTSTFVSRGRRGTNSHPPSFRVAGVALMAHSVAPGLGLVAVTPVTPRHFAWHSAWQAWHNLTSTFVLRCRRGTNSHPPSFRVAGVALMALSGALGLGLVARDARDATLRGTLRGRRGTISHPPSFCVTGVPQSHIHLRFAWQAWHSWHWVARLDLV